MKKCAVCKVNDSTGPKNVHVEKGPVTEMITVHMCDSCYQKFRAGEVKFAYSRDPKTGEILIGLL